MGGQRLREIQIDLGSAEGLDTLRKPLNEVALLAAGGDGAALDVLLATIDARRLSKPAISRQLFDRDDQEDVAQDVLIAVARSISGFRGQANVLTWLHTISTNCALGFIRRRRDTTDLSAIDLSMNAKFTSIASDKAVVRTAINELPELYQAAVILRDLHGFSYADIASKLDLNINTARARIARGRALVSQRLGSSVIGMEQ